MRNSKHIVALGTGVWVFALTVNLAICLKGGLNAPMESDAEYFRGLAVNLAAGKGYVLDQGFTFWPGAPTMRRLPGWPLAVSLAFRLFGTSDGVMRGLNVIINATVALLLFSLTLRLSKRVWVAALAALGYAIHPTALRLTSTGFSEPLFLLLTVGGMLLLLVDMPDGGLPVGWRSFAGFLLFGLACLVRANFVLWLPWYVLLIVAVDRGRLPRDVVTRRGLVAVVAVALFVLPSSLWMLRNWRVCGHFPVMSTIKGQTFYGGNNAVVATQSKSWGYWVFPNEIPGEFPMGGLAKSMSEWDVDAYYMKKGKAFVRDHRAQMPKLLLGKLLRAYLPIPWTFSIGTLVVSAFRWVLYITAAVGFVMGRRELPPVYGRCLVAMFLTSAMTVLVFWGCARFAFAVEPFLLPFCAMAVTALWAKMRGHRAASAAV